MQYSVGTAATPDDDFAASARRNDIARLVRQAVALVAQAAALCVLLFAFAWRVPQVSGRSMEPLLHAGDHVVLDTLAYDARVGGADPLLLVHLHAIRRGDVVAFAHPVGGVNETYLKRVAGLPGDRVDVAGRATVVPPDSVYVLGDNPAESDDSRAFGPIPRASIVGKAMFVVWPRVAPIR